MHRELIDQFRLWARSAAQRQRGRRAGAYQLGRHAAVGISAQADLQVRITALGDEVFNNVRVATGRSDHRRRVPVLVSLVHVKILDEQVLDLFQIAMLACILHKHQPPPCELPVSRRKETRHPSSPSGPLPRLSEPFKSGTERAHPRPCKSPRLPAPPHLPALARAQTLRHARARAATLHSPCPTPRYAVDNPRQEGTV